MKNLASLAAFPPAPHNPMLLEAFIVGEEHSFDSVCIDGRLVWHSISRYHPAPLEVLCNDWIPWVVILRHPETEAIAEALQRLIGLVRVQLG